MIEYIITSAAFSALPVVFIKKYLETEQLYYVLLAATFNLLLVYLYIIILKEMDASTEYALVKALSILLVAFYGIFILNESPNCYKLFGIVLSIIAVYFLS
jgi:multidrug transporter EmrE-like cation transporter